MSFVTSTHITQTTPLGISNKIVFGMSVNDRYYVADQIATEYKRYGLYRNVHDDSNRTRESKHYSICQTVVLDAIMYQRLLDVYPNKKLFEKEFNKVFKNSIYLKMYQNKYSICSGDRSNVELNRFEHDFLKQNYYWNELFKKGLK